MQHLIYDGMQAHEVWDLLDDVLGSVKLACGDDLTIYTTVRDYLTNHVDTDA